MSGISNGVVLLCSVSSVSSCFSVVNTYHCCINKKKMRQNKIRCCPTRYKVAHTCTALMQLGLLLLTTAERLSKNTDTGTVTVAFYADVRRAHYVLFPYFGTANSDPSSCSIAAKLPNRTIFLIYSRWQSIKVPEC